MSSTAAQATRPSAETDAAREARVISGRSQPAGTARKRQPSRATKAAAKNAASKPAAKPAAKSSKPAPKAAAKPKSTEPTARDTQQRVFQALMDAAAKIVERPPAAVTSEQTRTLIICKP
jgi:hypothetical protein